MNEFVFKDNKGERVTNPKYSWTICEKQTDLFYTLRRDFLRAAGLGHPRDDEGWAVDCVASSKFIDMKHRIFDYALTLLPEDMAKTFKENNFHIINGEWVFDKVINIFLKIVV